MYRNKVEMEETQEYNYPSSIALNTYTNLLIPNSSIGIKLLMQCNRRRVTVFLCLFHPYLVSVHFCIPTSSQFLDKFFYY